jgi:TolA-binding protein
MGEKVGNVGDDLIVRQMDFPGADVLADRLAAANPLSQVDEKLDIPPQVQMKMKQADATIKQMQQAIQQLQQELKYKTSIEQMKQDGETKRTLMVESGKAHDSMLWANEERNDTAVDNQTKKEIAEIQAHVELLLARIDERKEIGKIEGAAKEAAEN